jgi:hypothetical protein
MVTPCEYSPENVSVILVNSRQGEDFLNSAIESNFLFADARPISEPISGDVQLQHPSAKSRQRYDFEKYIVSTNCDFEKTMRIVIKRQRQRDICYKVKSTVHKVTSKIFRMVSLVK